ncbi:hypothetical protein O181_090119 [Austropuccinia psidii MF-1]|uniref:Uncharacterized protein n=1 Tax=Austropuccinia psidii MF-1 TaxID=1389203 RepID=A0A9Q3IUZ2_9BASI|nr:hypothetical protein [Austropuccinia psidii MF-1]
MPGELEHAIKFRFNQSCTVEDIANTLKDVRKGTNIGKYSKFKNSSFKEKQPFRVDCKEKPKGKMAEATKKKNTCHNCDSTDRYAKNYPKAKEKVYAIKQVPEEKSQTEDSESDSMGDAIREQFDEDQDPREEFPVEYPEETQLETQDIQLKAGIPQETANKNLCKDTRDEHTFIATQTKGIAYIFGTATKMIVFIENAQYPLIIDSGAHFSISIYH